MKNKNLVPKSGFQKVWKILLSNICISINQWNHSIEVSVGLLSCDWLKDFCLPCDSTTNADSIRAPGDYTPATEAGPVSQRAWHTHGCLLTGLYNVAPAPARSRACLPRVTVNRRLLGRHPQTFS